MHGVCTAWSGPNSSDDGRTSGVFARTVQSVLARDPELLGVCAWRISGCGGAGGLPSVPCGPRVSERDRDVRNSLRLWVARRPTRAHQMHPVCVRFDERGRSELMCPMQQRLVSAHRQRHLRQGICMYSMANL